MNMGNPKRSSKFLCLNCMKINELGSGIQRGGHQREKWHIKDLTCFNKPCELSTTLLFILTILSPIFLNLCKLFSFIIVFL